MAWPAVLESFFVAFAGMVDSLMVSSIGAYAVAAVGLTTQPKFIALAMFIAMNVSVSAIVARRKGQQDRYGANQTLLLALLFVLAAGVVVSVVVVYFADPIIRLCGSGEDTHEGAVLYFRIIVGGMMFNIISLAINAAQRGVGRTKIAMKTNVTANVINMIGNYLLIGGKSGISCAGNPGGGPGDGVWNCGCLRDEHCVHTAKGQLCQHSLYDTEKSKIGHLTHSGRCCGSGAISLWSRS